MNIGIDLGGSHIALAKVENGKVINKKDIKITDLDRQGIIGFIEDNILEYIGGIYKEEKIETIGIAVPGTVTENKIIQCVNLGIENYPIVERLRNKILETYGIDILKIKLANDAKCAAVAEHEYGCLKGYDDSIFLTLGTGIGGAVIINNKLLNAKTVPGYEFGHMTIDSKSDRICKCGKKGCFEQFASMRVFKNNIRDALHLNEYISGIQIYDMLKYNKALNRNDKSIENVINEFVNYLAIGISNLINIFEPEIIGIGGSFSYFEEFITDRLINTLKSQNLLFNKRDDIIIKSAILSNDAGMIGASIIAQEE